MQLRFLSVVDDVPEEVLTVPRGVDERESRDTQEGQGMGLWSKQLDLAGTSHIRPAPLWAERGTLST